jgi:predicted ATPase
LEEAQRFVAEKGERWYEPELLRLQGQLTLAAGGARDDAWLAFEASRAVAGARGARSLELRAAIRLARLDAEAGERQRARALLGPIYGWFTEGFETADLIEARTLLDELA